MHHLLSRNAEGMRVPSEGRVAYLLPCPTSPRPSSFSIRLLRVLGDSAVNSSLLPYKKARAIYCSRLYSCLPDNHFDRYFTRRREQYAPKAIAPPNNNAKVAGSGTASVDVIAVEIVDVASSAATDSPVPPKINVSCTKQATVNVAEPVTVVVPLPVTALSVWSPPTLGERVLL